MNTYIYFSIYIYTFQQCPAKWMERAVEVR
jgi:hypothetical protein